MINKSIISKVSIPIVASLLIVLLFLGLQIYNSQIRVITNLQDDQKAYIISNLNKAEQKAIDNETLIIHALSTSSLGAIKESLFNVDVDVTEQIMNDFMLRESIKAAYIYDSFAKEKFLSVYKEKNILEYDKDIPKEINDLLYYSYDLIANEQVIGYINIYYDLSLITQEMKKIKLEELKKFHKKEIELNQEIEQELFAQAISFLIGVIFVILIIVYLLKTVVNKPLIEFKNGLQSFFDYLSNPKNKVETINIDSSDEFGQMTKSVNSSIEVSIQLHEDISQRSKLTAKLNRELEESEYELQLLNENLEVKIEERTADLNIAKEEIEATHKHTRESITYASLIQSAVLPNNNDMRKYFQDQFVIWHPKDTVGGDIYLFNQLRNENECLLLFIDCTGHGVPGAFVTMLVKAVETQIIAEIMNKPDLEISPAWIMQYFNRTLKKLLKQENKNSVSNAGWDGGIIYYNKKTKILKFAGAETPLFYVDNEGNFNTIKGNRYSVGYKKCDANYEYKETILNVQEGMKFYCTTDGYLDQNGGEKDFPFGKKRFGNIIKEYHHESMADQQEMFLYEMAEYEELIENNDRNDDMTVIGFTL